MQKRTNERTKIYTCTQNSITIIKHPFLLRELKPFLHFNKTTEEEEEEKEKIPSKFTRKYSKYVCEYILKFTNTIVCFMHLSEQVSVCARREVKREILCYYMNIIISTNHNQPYCTLHTISASRTASPPEFDVLFPSAQMQRIHSVNPPQALFLTIASSHRPFNIKYKNEYIRPIECQFFLVFFPNPLSISRSFSSYYSLLLFCDSVVSMNHHTDLRKEEATTKNGIVLQLEEGKHAPTIE